MDKEIILNTSDEAAIFKTGISGWVSRNGHFYGDEERLARWDGCTHVVCECGNLAKKGWTKCAQCRVEAMNKKFEAMERKKWDGETPLCIFDTDHYFFDTDDLDYYCDCNGCFPEDLQLVICEPMFLSQINDDYWSDELPDDGELPDDVVSALNGLNAAIKKAEPVGWMPGNYAAKI